MKFNKLLFGIAATLSIFVLASCGSSKKSTSASSSTKQTTSSTNHEKYLNKLTFPQLSTTVADNEDLVEMTTTEGTIKIKLFPEIAPKAVENFITHAKADYYNNTTFHRVISEFMIQGGDPKGDGTGGESIWGKGFKTENSDQLYNIRGALSMARSTSRTSNASQFFIVQNDEDQSDGLAKQYYPQKIIEAYKNGGYPDLDGEYTVFGQVIEGMDVVDKIATAEVKENSSGEKSTPVNPVKVEKITVLQEAK